MKPFIIIAHHWTRIANCRTHEGNGGEGGSHGRLVAAICLTVKVGIHNDRVVGFYENAFRQIVSLSYFVCHRHR